MVDKWLNHVETMSKPAIPTGKLSTSDFSSASVLRKSTLLEAALGELYPVEAPGSVPDRILDVEKSRSVSAEDIFSWVLWRNV